MNLLNGQRVLVLEEQPAIALLLTEMLEALNCRVIGPAKRLHRALELLAADEVDAAIVDVKIKGEPSCAVAEELIRRGIPWAFASSNNADPVARRYPAVPLIIKPYSSAHIERVLEQLLLARSE